MFLLQMNILHTVISLFFAALIILLILRWILSFFVRDGNPIMLFMARCTDPVIAPIRKRIPPVLFLDVSWFFAWFALFIMRALLLQALPIGW